jgi:hypothetical protein
MPRPSHSSRFYHPHNSGRGVQIIKLLIMIRNLYPRFSRCYCSFPSPLMNVL